MTSKVRLGIIGLGAQGSMYAKFITDGLVPNMEIGAIADRDPAKAAVVEADYGVPFFDELHPPAGQRHRRRRRHLRPALPAPGDRHQRPGP